jgi:glycosyltransferase involved in cell wall biosynthesis
MKNLLALICPVRDEADIIKQMLQFHLERGVDFAVVLDNGSVDGTRDILASLHPEVMVLDDLTHTNDHAGWGNRMVGEATGHGAGWILACDADEFWYPRDGNYRAEMTGEVNVLTSRWNNFVPQFGRRWQEFNSVGDMANVYTSGVPKVAFSTADFKEITQGFHSVHLNRQRELGSANLALYHYPVRSYEQFERKVINAGSSYARNPAAQQNSQMGWHVRTWYERYLDGSLLQVYNDLGMSAKNVRTDRTMEHALGG